MRRSEYCRRTASYETDGKPISEKILNSGDGQGHVLHIRWNAMYGGPGALDLTILDEIRRLGLHLETYNHVSHD